MRIKLLTGIVLVLGLAAVQQLHAQKGTQTVGVPVSYSLPTDGPLPKTYRVTLAITAPDDPDWIVSTFVAGVARTVTAENQGKFTESWDGLDENFMPVPPGSYGVKGIYMPAKPWPITGEYHTLVPKLAAAPGDSWFPSRAQLDAGKTRWLWGAGFGYFSSIDVGPNGRASFFHSYIENSTNPFLVDLNRPIDFDQVLAGYGSGGAAGGWATATDGELIWCLCDNGGIPFVYRADAKPFGTGRSHYRRNVYVPKGEPTDLAAWRDPQLNKRFVYVSQEMNHDPRFPLYWQKIGWTFPMFMSHKVNPSEGNNIVVLDGDTGAELGAFPITHPRAIRVVDGKKLIALHQDAEGKWAISEIMLAAGMPTGDWRRLFTLEGIASPTGCAMDSEGNVYISDTDANQVYKLDNQGHARRCFGRATQQQPGHYDEKIFMSPGKLTIWKDQQGKERLLVLELSGPYRISEWSTDGTLLRQWFSGQFTADGGYVADPDKPEDIYCGTTLSATGFGLIRYKVDYEKGAWKVDAVWPGICANDNWIIRGMQGVEYGAGSEIKVTKQMFPGGGWRPKIYSYKGRKYLTCARATHNPYGVIIYRQDGDNWIPSAALIPKVTPEGKLAGGTDAYWWHDANGDGKLQDEEYLDNPTKLPTSPGYWGDTWLDDLSLTWMPGYGRRSPEDGYTIWRSAPTGFDKFGNPMYDGKSWTKLLTDTVYAARKAGTADGLHGGNEQSAAFPGDWQCLDGSMKEGFYVSARGGVGFGGANEASQYKISRYVPDEAGGFKMKWRVGRAVYGRTMGSANPGEIYGAIFITQPVNGLLGVQDSTMGLYHIYTDEGMYVDTLFVDGKRFPMTQGGYLLGGENFSGYHFLNRKNGKVYVAMTCNQPCDLYEVEGWTGAQNPVQPIRSMDRNVNIAANQIASPPERALLNRGGAGKALLARFYPATGAAAMDGSLNGWQGCTPVRFQSGEKQTVEVRCLYAANHLYLRWHARLDRKFDPKPLEPADRIFTHDRNADTLSFYIQGDPNAKPGTDRPGDARIVFGLFKEGGQLRPVALGMYPKWPGPGKPNPMAYGTATAAPFEHVGLIAGAQLGFKLDEDGKGFVIAAAIPREAIPLLPELDGQARTLVNFEANFGGHNKFWWANANGSASTETYDEPTEARLYQGSWAPAQWMGLDQMYVHEWNIVGPFGFAGLPALDVSDGRVKILATLASKKYPPEEKVDLAATYTGDMTQTRDRTRTLKWKQIAEPANLFDFDRQLGWPGRNEEGAAYALTYLYSPTAAEITLHNEGGPPGHNAIRGWINGQPLPLDPKSLPVAGRPYSQLGYRIDATQPVTLQAGWNELLLRFDFIFGDKLFGLRLDGKPETLWGLRISATPPEEEKK